MAKQGQSSAKDAAFATLATRQAKKARNQDELNQLWRERAAYHGFNPEHVIEQAKSGEGNIKENEVSDELKQIVIDAIDDLAQSRNVFSEQHIIQQVLGSQGKRIIRVSDLLTVITEMSNRGTLVALPGDGQRYTTQQLFDQEQVLIKQAQNGKGALQPIFLAQHLKLWLKRNPDCDAFEEKALLRIFATKHQFQGILGSNSGAQARLIHHIKHLSALAEIQPVLLSSAQIRSQQLSQQYGMASFNVYQWIKIMSQTDGDKRLGACPHQTLLLVDEAQLLSLPQLHQLMRISQQTKTHLIFFGDQNRLSSFSQTNALQLLDHHLPKMYLPKIKAADEKNTQSKGSLSDGKMSAVVALNIIAIEDQQSCTRQMARHYTALQKNHNGPILIVMPSHAQSHAMNLAVRKVLQDRNMLSKREYAIAIIQPNQDNKISTCSIGQGERVMWQSNQPKLGLVRGESLEVAQITSDKMTLRKADGKILEQPIDSKHPLPLTYAYSLTPYRAVYQNPEIILAYQPSNHSQTNQQQLNHWKNLAQLIYIYTDDKARYLDNIARVHQKPLTTTEMMTTLQQQNQHESPLKKALSYAIAHLSEREAVFDEHTLKTVMLEQTIGTVSPEKFDQLWVDELLPDAKENGLLLECKQDGKTLFTTPEALKLEQNIIGLAKQGQGQYVPISHAQIIHQFLKKSLLNLEQRQAIQLMMTHDHQFMLIQGIAGSGKTTTMSVAQSFFTEQDRGFRLLGLAPTHQAVRVLTECGIRAQTLQSYLKGYRQSQNDDAHQNHSKTILLLDEASMVSNRQMYDFLQSCHQTGARAVIMGDIQQLPAIEAGKPFVLLQTLDVPIAELTETERYAEGSPLKSAVSAIHQGDVSQTFKVLQQDFHEEKSKLESLTKVAKQYLAIPQDQRSKLQIITPSHHDRVLFNSLVRVGLKRQGELGENSVTVNVLVNRNLTRAERTKTNNYRLGDVLKFHNSHGLPIEKGSYLKVAELVPKSNAVVLTDQKEQRYYWQLPTLKSQQSLGVEIYRPEQRELSVGDQIRWLCSTSSNKNESRAQSAVITHIENDDTLQVKQADGALNTLDISNLKHLHFDHGYAGTAHALQGITVEQAQLVLRSDQKYLANQKTFLVAISRSISSIGVYTDNWARLLERLTHNRGDKTSSIEMMGTSSKEKLNLSMMKRNNTKRLPNLSKSATQPLSQYDYSALLQDRLRQSLPSLLKKIMVEGPRKKTQHHYYYGHNKGSLAVSISGEKQGLWYDFQTGEGGNVLQLIQEKLGLNFKQARDYIAQHLSISQKDLKLPKVKSAIQISGSSGIPVVSFKI